MSNKKKKNILRIGALISIAMFVLIPLLSSPVAAAAHTDPSSGTTSFSAINVPSASVAPIPGIVRDYDDDSPYTIEFKCSYSFTDLTTAGGGSNHRVNLWIQKTLPSVESPKWDEEYQHLDPSTGPITGSISVFDTWGQGEPTSWTVIVTAIVEEDGNPNNKDDATTMYFVNININ